MACFRVDQDGVYLDLKVLPGASRTQWMGEAEGRLKVKVAAAPEDGKANAALRASAASLLGCAKKEVVLCRGEKSRLKTLRLPLGCLDAVQCLLSGGSAF